MTTILQTHSERTRALIDALAKDRNSMAKLLLSVLGGEGAPMFPLDLMALAAVKRNASIPRAIEMMVDSWNMIGARTLLRVHIDTSLRFSAAWLVKDPHDFASKVLAGERIDIMKSQGGEKLRDAYLVEVRCTDYPWLKEVYRNLSGYVHFSGSHIYDTVSTIADDTRMVGFLISENDRKFPEFSWNEVLECCRETNEMLAYFLSGYGITKRMSPAELDAARGG
ncbi:hypothetical protein [Xanthomonas campestris]|uniref:hypothetical protein n=1 Tax=Xanthomonas campestris TaxID=339 RepID=UPI002368A5BA|nr:hypothetical protein [Xanthomonas campestris]WDJ93593.1 hypothetical protein JH260_19365 [Xanthomonas campestris pv. incanae]